MTVKELITELEKYPPDLSVMCNDSENGGFLITHIRLADKIDKSWVNIDNSIDLVFIDVGEGVQ